MAAASETGHAKNVATFEDLISFCTAYGAAYSPSKAALKIASLITLRKNAEDCISSVTGTKTQLTTAINKRQEAFEPLKKLCTKIVNALDATDASDKLVKDARSINKKMQGKRVGEKPAPVKKEGSEEAEDKSISVAQLSFDSLIDTFHKVITLVSSEPTYMPNETELQVSTLTATLGNLKARNSAAINAVTDYSNARITRDIILYAPSTGLVDIALGVKQYVKSVFGAGSPQFIQVSKLEFKRR